jgi:membrane associated rhomboid family serine protease
VDTSGSSTASVILDLVVLALFINVGLRLLVASPLPRKVPVVAITFVVLVGVPSLVQFALPAVGEALVRNPDLTLHHGEWWRVLTAIAAQDGGLTGAVFNLIVLAGVLTLGEWIWGRWRTVVLFLAPSVILNLLAIGWNQPGGGSSFATDGLIMSMCGLGLVISKNLVVRLCASVAVVIGVVLVFLNDAHGVAILVGAALGVAFAVVRTRSQRGAEPVD